MKSFPLTPSSCILSPACRDDRSTPRPARTPNRSGTQSPPHPQPLAAVGESTVMQERADMVSSRNQLAAPRNAFSTVFIRVCQPPPWSRYHPITSCPRAMQSVPCVPPLAWLTVRVSRQFRHAPVCSGVFPVLQRRRLALGVVGHVRFWGARDRTLLVHRVKPHGTKSIWGRRATWPRFYTSRRYISPVICSETKPIRNTITAALHSSVLMLVSRW